MKLNYRRRVRVLTGGAVGVVSLLLLMAGCAAINPAFNPDFHPGPGKPASTAGATGAPALPGVDGSIILPGKLPADFPADVPVESGEVMGGFIQSNGSDGRTWFFDVTVEGSVDAAIASVKSDYEKDGYTYEDVGSQVHMFQHKDTYYYNPDADAVGLKFVKDRYSVLVSVTTDLQESTLVTYAVDRLPNG